MGVLGVGDKLPTVKGGRGQEVAINPNTVSKAYRELEHEGASSRDVKAWRRSSPAAPRVPLPAPRPVWPGPLNAGSRRLVPPRALDDEAIGKLLLRSTLRATFEEGVA